MTLVTCRMKALWYKKAYFILNSLVGTSEDFSIRDILYWKTYCIFPNVDFFFFLLKRVF